jgi:hypothetical protein
MLVRMRELKPSYPGLRLIHTDDFLQALEDRADGASVHMRGLVNMVRMRGGLESFDHSPTIQRVITWYVIIAFGRFSSYPH